MNREPVLLIVDDDSANLESYSMGFARQPYRLLKAEGGAQAVKMLKSEDENIDVVLTDLKMPEVDGLEVVRAASAARIPAVSIVITAYGTIESAVEAMRLGAFDYITKPVNLSELRTKVEKAIQVRQLRLENEALEPVDADKFKFEGVIGNSSQMSAIIEEARMVAATKVSALVEGESGTGKELIARAIHYNSPRAEKPFVPIHCAALPETLLESELFGHEQGAFTDAHQQRIGKFESANGGTVFLDELAEIPLTTQVKLLRVLEQREVTRVGATHAIPIDIRLVAATNKDLDKEVEEGRFREDLYYRLNVVRIRIPPLRERPEDIPPLVEHFLKQLTRENRRPNISLTDRAMTALCSHPWYGNVRELRNVIEQIVVFARDTRVDIEDLPASLELTGFDAKPEEPATPKAGASPGADVSLAELEKEHILRTLKKMGGNRTRAAKKLGISRRTMQRKLKEMGYDED
ncbi:MAG: sigma-54-dependent transcriptional regulator [Candidatus Sumerlaeia bacterium]